MAEIYAENQITLGIVNDGEAGKSAYQAAQEAGYTESEAQFNGDLAQITDTTETAQTTAENFYRDSNDIAKMEVYYDDDNFCYCSASIDDGARLTNMNGGKSSNIHVGLDSHGNSEVKLSAERVRLGTIGDQIYQSGSTTVNNNTVTDLTNFMLLPGVWIVTANMTFTAGSSTATNARAYLSIGDASHSTNSEAYQRARSVVSNEMALNVSRIIPTTDEKFFYLVAVQNTTGNISVNWTYRAVKVADV